jgi:hypothetical protein
MKLLMLQLEQQLMQQKPPQQWQPRQAQAQQARVAPLPWAVGPTEERCYRRSTR